MASPYSQDLRDRVLAAYDRGMPTKEIAIAFDVSPAWARRLKQRRRETGETAPRPMACRTRETLWQAMQSVLDTVTPNGAANRFRHCGYSPRQE